MPTEDGRVPDPEGDRIVAVFYAFQKLDAESIRTGTIIVGTEHLNKSGIRFMSLEEVSSELDLLNSLVDIIIDLDPDIITGWDVQQSSWGFVSKRATHYGSFYSYILFLALVNEFRVRTAGSHFSGPC